MKRLHADDTKEPAHKRQKRNSCGFHPMLPCIERGALTKNQACEIISLLDRFDDWDADSDIDDEPSLQISFEPDHGKLIPSDDEESQIAWKLARMLEPLDKQYLSWLRNLTGNSALKTDFVFIRKYSHDTRQRFTAHFDENDISIVVQISDPSNYTGGEFYLYDYKTSREYREEIGSLSFDERDKWIEKQTYSNGLPFVDLRKGDAIMFFGDSHLHGVLPVKQGVRYSLMLFYETMEGVSN